MAELVAGFLGPAIEVVNWVAKPIKRELNYLCCFTTNINGLKDEAKSLDDEVVELQGRVDIERESLRVIVPKVETWLAKSKNIKDETTTIFVEVPEVESGCLKLGARFSLSRRAKQTTDRMKELRDECKFAVISQEGPSAATQEIPLGKAYLFNSRKQTEEDVIKKLRGMDVRMIGICGTGGLGKTTMAKRIINRVLNEQVFQEAVMVVVSQQVDKSKLQLEISGSLGLELEKVTSEDARRKKLHARLSDTKRILIVLDDVWVGLEVEDLGIPRNSKGCTILITSRNKDALIATGCGVQQIFGMEVLSDEDAWFLFTEEAGICVDDTRLKSIAKQVMKQCKGFPIALSTVGAALKHEKDASIWKDALRQLSQSHRNIPHLIEKVYNSIKVSYDFLRSTEAKSLFLLCCLYPEDANIHVEKLTWFCMGLCIFEDVRNLEEARSRMSRLIKLLTSRSLLLDCNYTGYVRMHDVVRDVCIFIAKQEGYIGSNDCTWISSLQRVEERIELPTSLGLANLRLLFLSRYDRNDEEFKFDGAFYEDTRDLSVLCIQRYHSLTSLPHSLTSLNSLVLESCENLKTISVVGELVNLEILSCRGCGMIEELPQEMKGLNRLKLLELTWCRNLQRIGAGIIASLVRLEELKMIGSFHKWEAQDAEETENAVLRELEALTNLRCLEIEIKDSALATEKMHLSSKMERFYVKFSTKIRFYPFDKILNLELKEETCLGDWIEKQLLRDTECLSLSGNGANNVDLEKSQHIRWLELKNIATLEEICPPLFTNLSSIVIKDCPRLRNLGQLSIAARNDCLPQLEELCIKECEMMEQVFLWNEEDENTNKIESANPPSIIKKMFSKLKKVELDCLPNLATFYQGTKDIEFPLMWKMNITECPKLKWGGNSGTDDDCLHLLCQVSFGNLKKLVVQQNPFCRHQIPLSLLNGLEKLVITGHHGNMSLFTSSIAGNLVNLKHLQISDCGEMLKVMEAEEEKKVMSGGQRTTLVVFPKLEYLHLHNLPKLVSFCEWKCDIELPSLSYVSIQECCVMRNFTLGPLYTPNLDFFEIDMRLIDTTKDLNIALEQHLARAKEEEEKEGGEYDQEAMG